MYLWMFTAKDTNYKTLATFPIMRLSEDDFYSALFYVSEFEKLLLLHQAPVCDLEKGYTAKNDLFCILSVKEFSLVTNSDFLILISLQLNGVNL